MKESASVLIVDDEKSWATSLCELLEPAGFKASYAVGGAEGLRRLITDPPDILLLDLIMGDIDGFEILREIKKRGICIRTIVLSAHPVPYEAAVKSVRLGAKDYLIKDEAAERLLDKVRRVLLLEPRSDPSMEVNSPWIEELLVTAEHLRSQNLELQRRNKRLQERLRWKEIAERFLYLGVATGITYTLFKLGAVRGGTGLFVAVVIVFVLLTFPINRIIHLRTKSPALETDIEASPGGRDE